MAAAISCNFLNQLSFLTNPKRLRKTAELNLPALQQLAGNLGHSNYVTFQLRGLLFLACASILPASYGRTLTPAWIELGAGRRAIVRIVMDEPNQCPAAIIDGASHPMSLRQPVPQGFKPACEIDVPANAKSASVNGQKLKLPRADPTRIVVLGDTGCRVNANQTQACNDPAQWPLQRIATRAASDGPSLVIHVGDYLYREGKCTTPQTCGTTTPGDNWEAWSADFFTPAAKLLAAAPWAFSRGNHEICQRSWRGWFYYLDPTPWRNSCDVFPPPYLVTLGHFELLMLDSSGASDRADKKQIDIYAAQLASIHATNAWLVDHHPLWALRAPLKSGPPERSATNMAEAWDKAAPQGIKLIVSGHTHLFELLSFDQNHPPQLVAGDGATALADPIPENLDHTKVSGATIADGVSRHEFGYTLMNKTSTGWTILLKSPLKSTILTCRIDGVQTHCH